MPSIRSLPIPEQLELLRVDVARIWERLGLVESPLQMFVPAINPGYTLRKIEAIPIFHQGADTPDEFDVRLVFAKSTGNAESNYNIQTFLKVGTGMEGVSTQINGLMSELDRLRRQTMEGNTRPLPLGEEDVARGKPPGA